jgi:hypothetical protein
MNIDARKHAALAHLIDDLPRHAVFSAFCNFSRRFRTGPNTVVIELSIKAAQPDSSGLDVTDKNRQGALIELSIKAAQPDSSGLDVTDKNRQGAW